VLVKRIASVEEMQTASVAVVSRNVGELSARLREVERVADLAGRRVSIALSGLWSGASTASARRSRRSPRRRPTSASGSRRSRQIDDFAPHIRALGDRMTALEKMLTGYVTDLNALADRHSSYMMETRLMVERLDKRLASGFMDGWQEHVSRVLFGNVLEGKPGLYERVCTLEQATGDQVERRGEVWRLIAPEIYEGLPRDITAPIGAIIQGLSERVETLEARPITVAVRAVWRSASQRASGA
jgi:hypothetical protein